MEPGHGGRRHHRGPRAGGLLLPAAPPDLYGLDRRAEVDADALDERRRRRAPGLRTLAKCLASAGHEVIVIAPDRERSGVSRCHAVRQELDLVRIEKENPYETWTLEGGTPVDCVMAAVAAFDGLELVIAGINRGPNLGRNIFYSGTVAAAAESVWRGLPAIAVSCAAISADRWWFETAAEVVKRLVAEGLPGRLNQELLLNVNVPNVPVAEIQGWVVSPPDRALHNWEKYRLEGDGLARYHLRPDGVVVNSRAAAGTDADAVQRRLVAVTPLGADLRARQVRRLVLSEWGTGGAPEIWPTVARQRSASAS